MKCFSSVIGLLFIYLSLVFIFLSYNFLEKSSKIYIIIILLLLLLLLLFVIICIILFYYYSFYALRRFIAFDSIQSSTCRVTRKVPSNVGILKQRKTTTVTWKAEKLFLSESTCLINGKMSLS